MICKKCNSNKLCFCRIKKLFPKKISSINECSPILLDNMTPLVAKLYRGYIAKLQKMPFLDLLKNKVDVRPIGEYGPKLLANYVYKESFKSASFETRTGLLVEECLMSCVSMCDGVLLSRGGKGIDFTWKRDGNLFKQQQKLGPKWGNKTSITKTEELLNEDLMSAIPILLCARGDSKAKIVNNILKLQGPVAWEFMTGHTIMFHHFHRHLAFLSKEWIKILAEYETAYLDKFERFLKKEYYLNNGEFCNDKLENLWDCSSINSEYFCLLN